MITRPVNVLYLNHASQLGGAEFALSRLIEAMNRHEVRARVLFAETGPAVDLMRQQGIDVDVIPLDERVRGVSRETLGGTGLFSPRRVFMLAQYAWRIAAYAQNWGADVLHTNSMKAHFYGGLAGRLSGIPVIWHVRDYWHPSYLPAPAVAALRMLARVLPSRIVTVSHSVLEQVHLPTGSPRGVAIHDGLVEREIQAFAQQARNQRPGSRPLRVGILGGLRAWKGQHVFLDAAARVLAGGFQAHFLVVGAPLFGNEHYAQSLHEQVEKLGIGEHVTFRGFTHDVPTLMGELDVLVHASTSADPCPNVVLEGMAAGLPVIASRGGGVPEMIEDGVSGLLTPMGDAEALGATLTGLLADPSRQHALGSAAAARVHRHFTSSRTAARTASLYAELAPQAGQTSRSASDDDKEANSSPLPKRAYA